MPGDNLAAVGLTNLFQQLLFTACLAAFFGARLIAAWILSMVKDQQPRLRFGGNLGQLVR